MNEKAIQDSYNIFKTQGYTKSLEEYKTLLRTNGNALNDSYKLFKTKGYNKSIDEYKTLMGLNGDPVKKKEATSAPKKKAVIFSPVTNLLASTSATSKPKTAQKPSASSGGKVDDSAYYKFPGNEKATYKKSGNKWFVDANSTGDYKPTNTSVVKNLETSAILDEDITYSKNKSIGKILGAQEGDQKNKDLLRGEVFTGFPGKEQNKYRIIDDKWQYSVPKGSGYSNWADVTNDNSIKALSTQFNKLGKLDVSKNIDYISDFKAKNLLGDNATEQQLADKKEYFNNIEKQKILRASGFDVPLNGNLKDPQTVAAFKLFDAKMESKSASNNKNTQLNDKIDSVINANLITNDEEAVVSKLRKEFGADGFIFDETGIGDAITVSYSIDGVQETEPITIDLQTFRGGAPEMLKLRSYMKTKHVGDYERKLIGADTDGEAAVGTDDKVKHYSDLVSLMAKNPAKYGTELVQSGEIDNITEQGYRDIKEKYTVLGEDSKKLEEKINQYNLNPTKELELSINNDANRLKQREYQLKREVGVLKGIESNYSKAVGAYASKKEKDGSFIGGLTASFGKGIASIPKTLLNVATDVMPLTLKNNGLSDQQYEQYKQDGLTDSDIANKTSSMLKRTVVEDVEKGIINIASLGGTTKEYLGSEDRGIVSQAVNALAESIGANISGGGNPMLQKLAFFSQSYNNMESQMSGAEFDDMNALEKKGISVLYGIGIGQLEKLGFDVSSGIGTNPLIQKFINYTVGNTLKSLPKNASIHLIEETISKNIKASIASNSIKVLAGGVAEATPEFVQSIGEVGLKNVVNAMHGKEYFQDVPDLTTAEGIKEALSLASYDALVGGIGGSIMGSYSTYKSNRNTATADKDFELMNASLTDPVLLKAVKKNTVERLRSGAINKEQAQAEYADIDKSVGILKTIPTNLSNREKRASYELLLEKNKLEKEIEGKDVNLVATLKARVAEINNELTKISEDATKESNVQEVTAEGGTSEYQGAGEGQQEVGVSEGSQRETTQPSTDRGDSVVAGEVQQEEVTRKIINRPSTLSEFGGQKFDTPLQGDTYIEGQQVIFEDRATGRVYELGNVDEVIDSPIAGLNTQAETVTVTNEGKISVDGAIWNTQPDLPTMGIEYNPVGEVQRVSLKDDNGNTTMFEGQKAVDIAYQIELQKIQSPEQQKLINDLLEQDEEFKTATADIKFTEAPVTIQEEAAPNIEQTTEQDQVATLRAEEQAEIKAKLPNAEYKADGKIDVDKLSVSDQLIYGSIYIKYDKLITPLLPATEATTTETVTTKEGPTVEQTTEQSEVNKLRALLGEEPKFQKENEDAISESEVDTVVEEMNAMPEDIANFDVPSDLTTKNKTNINSLIKRFGAKLKSAFKGGIIKDISDYNGIPMIFTISDQLTSGDIKNEFTGNTIDVNGGIGFNLTEGNENSAWANTSEAEAEGMLSRAQDVYSKNKDLFDRLWSEGKLPKGQIPMAIVKMGQDSIQTNEALFRFASDTIKKKFNKSERVDSLNGLIEDISAVNPESKVISFIKENNFTTIDELLDNMNRLKPIGERTNVSRFLFTGGISLSTETKPGKPRSKAALALVGNKDSSYYKYIHLQTINNAIQDQSTKDIPSSHVIGITGVDVLNPEITNPKHRNYPYGVKGGLIGILESPVHAADVFPEMYSKSFYLNKENKSGKLPSPKKAVGESVAASGPVAGIKAFRGAKISTKMTEIQKLLGKLRLAFPNVTVVDTQEEFDKTLESKDVKKFVKDGEVVYGFTKDGKIFLNPKKANSNTAIHEYSHIWMGFLKENNPGLLAKAYTLLEGTEILKRKIAELGDVELAREEALAELIANKGETLIEAGKKSKFKNWLNAVFSYVKSNFKAFDKLTAEEFQNISLNEFVDGSLASLLGGKEVTSKEIKNIKLLFSKGNAREIIDVVKIARDNGISDTAIRQYLTEEGYSDKNINDVLEPDNGDVIVSKIREASQKELIARQKKLTIRDRIRAIRNKFIDRQSDIKRLIKGIGSKESIRAYNLLVNKAGASGFANYRFKNAEADIYKGLSKNDLDTLDDIIYARRMVAINESRAKQGAEPYTGMDGYSEVKALKDLDAIKNKIGEKKFNELSVRATKYFGVFSENLKKLYESGRINEETYINLRDIEYSPIRTIKYIIGDNLDPATVDREASKLGVSKKDIMALTDSNDNAIISDSKWLLMLNVMSVEGRAFENKMLNEFSDAIDGATQEQRDAMSEFIIDNPIVKQTSTGSIQYKYNQNNVPIGYSIVSFFKNGVKKDLVVKDAYATQLLDIKTSNRALSLIGTLTGAKVLRFFATGGNPLFIIGNTAVDFQNILFFSDVYSKFKLVGGAQLSYDFVKNFIKGAATSNRKNKIYNEYVEHGGAMDFLSNDGLRSLKSLSPKNKILNLSQKVLVGYGNIMSYLGEKSELAFRLAVYDKVKGDEISKFKKENGRDPDAKELDDIMYEATRNARETMDFNQGGTWVKTIDNFMPYLNASMQGFRRPLEYAKTNPLGFANSLVQASIMAGSVAALSLAALMRSVGDDDEEEKKKVLDVLESLSDYEKATYHIIFTGKKDKDGEYEYYRIKKLPVLSVISTMTEQFTYKYLLSEAGIKYDVDQDVINRSISASTPFSPNDIMSRNPLVSALITYGFDYDTFTGEKIFREPRDKKILATAEGMYDDKVEEIYKQISPALGLSPIRTKAAIEKIVTSENTNPMISIFYASINGFFNKDGYGAEFSDAFSNVFDASARKLKRTTNKDNIRYKQEDKIENQEMIIETDIYNKEQKVYNTIKNVYKDGKELSNGELVDLIKTNFEKKDHEKYAKKYYAYIKNMNIDRSILDILYEETPEVQALRLYNRYGSELDTEEKKILSKVMGQAKMKLSKQALYIYDKKYSKRK